MGEMCQLIVDGVPLLTYVSVHDAQAGVQAAEEGKAGAPKARATGALTTAPLLVSVIVGYEMRCRL